MEEQVNYFQNYFMDLVSKDTGSFYVDVQGLYLFILFGLVLFLYLFILNCRRSQTVHHFVKRRIV